MPLHLAEPLPKGAEALADLAEAAGKKFGISPYLLLGICYAESNFGQALKPKSFSGTGDFIARKATPERDAKMKTAPLPNVVRKTVPGIKERGISEPCDAWVPTSTGWGCGILQVDYEAHFDFCKSGAWADPAKSMEYACKILTDARAALKKELPRLSGSDLDRCVIAAYNAGARRVAKFTREGKKLDEATFHPGYVDKICRKADALAGHSGAWLGA